MGSFTVQLNGVDLIDIQVQSWLYTEKFFWVQLTFALSLTGLLSHLGSNICKTQDQRHSDTTPLFTEHGENFQGEKPSN